MKRKQTQPQLSRRARRAILALVEQPTQEKAAQAAGVSKTTLWRWQKEPDFQKALSEATRERYSQVFTRMQQAAPAAVMTLLRVMTDPKAPALQPDSRRDECSEQRRTRYRNARSRCAVARTGDVPPRRLSP